MNPSTQSRSAYSKPLSEVVLRRLTNGALTTFLGQAARYEAAARPGLQLALSNEPVADLNMLVVGAGADREHFREWVSSCLRRELPFLVMVFPETEGAVDELAAKLGLVYAVDFPIMVREDQPLETSGNPEVEVARAHGAEDADASADVLSSAFGMPKDSLLRAMPPSLFETTGADVYIARLNGEAVGSVTLTYHGDTAGIWALGTLASRQRGGIGGRLLSAAMVEARNRGTRRFFLGATPVGFRLYERLGFTTVCSTRIWVSGVTHQA